MKILNTLHANGVILAVILLILAFIVAAIVKSVVVKVLSKTKLNKIEETASEDGSGQPKQSKLVTYIGKLAYLLVFLLFVPGIFSALGVSSITEPITSMLSKIWNYVPNVLAAIIILVVGSLIAKLVRTLLIPVFQKIKVDKLQEKAGVEVKTEHKLSYTLAYIIYVLIMIPVVIVALKALNITAIAEPAQQMLTIVITFIPNIVVAIILIWIGLLISKFIGQILTRIIGASGVDAKIHGLLGEKAQKFELSAAVGLIIRVVLSIFFIVEGVKVLKLSVLTHVGETIIAYMPRVLAAALIVIAAYICVTFVEKAMSKAGLKKTAVIVKAGIWVIAAFMVLSQLGIAPKIVETAFMLLLLAAAAAFAIAFGIGGRKFAADTLDKLSEKFEKEKEEAKTAAEAAEAAEEPEAPAPAEDVPAE